MEEKHADTHTHTHMRDRTFFPNTQHVFAQARDVYADGTPLLFLNALSLLAGCLKVFTV